MAGEHLERGSARLVDLGADGTGVAERDLGVGVGERQPRRRRALPGGCAERRSGEPEARRYDNTEEARRRTTTARS